jgi:hypothetical protein
MSDSQDYQPVSQIAEESEVVMSLQSPAGEKMKVSCWQLYFVLIPTTLIAHAATCFKHIFKSILNQQQDSNTTPSPNLSKYT